MVRSIKNLIAALLISISAYLAWTIILPKYEYSKALKLVIEEKLVLLESRNEVVKKIEGSLDEYQEKYSGLQRLALVVPEKKALPELISTLEDIYSKTGNVLGELNIGTGTTGSEQKANIVSFGINLETNYESLISFLGYIERNIRLIDMNSISISIKPGEEVGNQSAILSVVIKTNTYYLKPFSESRPVPRPDSGTE